MENNIIAAAHELIDAMATLVSAAVQPLHLNSDVDPDKIARFDFSQFFMYLSASDGTIKDEEAQFINDVCGLDEIAFSSKAIAQIIREHNLYSTEFENEAPLGLQLLVAFDNKVVDAGKQYEVSDGTKPYIETMESIGRLFIQIDGNVDSNKESDLKIYINSLHRYVNLNSKRYNSTTGFIKNTGSFPDGNQNGVAAPKKKV